MKTKSVKFEGQLRGDKDKETYFSKLREENKLKLPEVGKTAEVELNPDDLTGAFLSMLDGKNSLSINGKGVSKMKVYSGEQEIPTRYSLTFKIERVSDVSCKLKANIQSK